MSTILMNLDEIILKPKEAIFRKKAEAVIESLRKRSISAAFVDTGTQAVEAICKMIPDGSVVALGGSVTIMQIGLLDALRTMSIELLDRYRPGITKQETEELALRGMTADILITSTNAVTADGKLVNEDGSGNRVGAMIFGPKKVIVVAGINKIVGTADDGLKRIKEYAAPLNCIRLGVDTPCARTGFCDDDACLAPARLCSQITIIESNRVKDRMHVLLVGQELGY
ncbi:MAG TPA: lactate utilization protein [Bacteroidetes bacterium]|nr:lactate utilization protein [Bacteroidota bacterium]